MKLAGPFLARLLRATAREIEATLPRVRAAADEEAIHDMRVGVRRMRVLLKIVRPIWVRVHVDVTRAGFTHIHRETSELRDEEVLRETLADAPLASESFLRFRAARARREDQLRGLTHAHLRHGALRRPLDKLHAMLLFPATKPIALERFALRVHDRLVTRVVAMKDVPTSDGVALHELRIAYKNLRYASELLAAALPPERAASEKPAARFQKHLGEIHDLDVAKDIVSHARALTLADRAALVAWLDERRAARVAKYVADRDSLVLVPAAPISPVSADPVRAPSPVASGRSRSTSRSTSGSPSGARSRKASPKA